LTASTPSFMLDGLGMVCHKQHQQSGSRSGT
jgi:hypothetical protein